MVNTQSAGSKQPPTHSEQKPIWVCLEIRCPFHPLVSRHLPHSIIGHLGISSIFRQSHIDSPTNSFPSTTHVNGCLMNVFPDFSVSVAWACAGLALLAVALPAVPVGCFMTVMTFHDFLCTQKPLDSQVLTFGFRKFHLLFLDSLENGNARDGFNSWGCKTWRLNIDSLQVACAKGPVLLIRAFVWWNVWWNVLVGAWRTPHCACYIPENGLNGLVAPTFFLLQILHLWRTPNGCNSVNCPEAQLLAGPPEKWQDMGGQMYKIESIGKLRGSEKRGLYEHKGEI